jgi:hypothetical protein
LGRLSAEREDLQPRGVERGREPGHLALRLVPHHRRQHRAPRPRRRIPHTQPQPGFRQVDPAPDITVTVTA